MKLTPVFTEPQQRHIETTLVLVDKAVQRVEFVLDRVVHHVGPSGVVFSLDDGTIKTLRRLFRELQRQAADLHHRYGFRTRKLDLARILDAELSHLWEMLEDCRPQRMRGYGAMESETAKQLEQEVTGLLEIVLRAQALLRAAEKSCKEQT